MKPLDLTEEQKDKILEMCKVLFPKDEFSWEYEMYGRELKQDFNDVLCVQHTLEKPKKGWDNELTKYKFFNIHWFEFCMTHLAEKIIATYVVTKNNLKIYKRTLNDDLSKFYLESLLFSRGSVKTHPVDYLYEEFKKLR